jgi:ribose-phosphate pyrophosphokinase
MRNDSQLKIFPGSSSKALTQKICDYLNVPMGKNKTRNFSDGNTYVRIEEKVRGMDVYIVQTIGLDPNNEFMELLFWLDAFKLSGAGSVTAIIPYFGYAKADKKDEPRVSIRARICADCLETAGVDRIVMMDLHSPQIQGFFRKPVDHLYAANIFCERISYMGISNCVIVAPDEGFAKNARYYSNRLRIPLAIGNKQRTSHNEEAEILGIMGDVKGKTAIIVDDFSVSCGTLVETAKVLEAKGAKEIYAFISHAPISEKGVAALNGSNIRKLFITDTIDNPRIAGCEKIEVITISTLFAKAINIIHEKDSLSALFV